MAEGVALRMDEPLPLAPGEIADPGRLADYLRGAIPGLEGPVEFFKFTAGNANLTYLVRAGERELVLKREPPGTKAKAAHDMSREHRFLAAVSRRYPLAPRPLLLCQDPAVLGGTFLVMERVRGVIVRQDTAAALGDGEARRQMLRLVDALADLHGLDVAEDELSGLGRPEGYRRRQVDGWRRRMDDARTPDTPETADIEAWLDARLPAGRQLAAVVHNDFKLDNLVWDAGDPTRLAAVLDWEMATLGDPFMDLGVTLSFWVESDDPESFRRLRAMPTARPGMPGRAEAWAAYGERRGVSSAEFGFYLAFALYRRAVIEQQKYRRFRSGQTDDPRFAALDAAVRALLDMCRREIARSTPQ